MEKRPASPPACKSESESHEIGAVKSAKNLATGLRRDDKQGNRDNISIRGFPDGSFDAHTGLKFFDPVAGVNEYAIANFVDGRIRAGALCLLPQFHRLDSAVA
jgi:hypothetical protein